MLYFNSIYIPIIIIISINKLRRQNKMLGKEEGKTIIEDLRRIVEDLSVKITELDEDELETFLEELQLQSNNLESLI